MANFKKHLQTGALVGLGFSLLYNIYRRSRAFTVGHQSDFDFKSLLQDLLVGTAMGAIGGILPDLMEPALNPNHRKTFHSVSAGLTLIHGMSRLEKSDTAPDIRTGLHSAGTGYLSHLILDLATPMGLPVI